jgi:hypothetical protein
MFAEEKAVQLCISCDPCRMRDGYFRRLVSSTIDVDRHALLLRSLKWLGVEARDRVSFCVQDTRMGQAGLRRL